jgi:hypothetical protein
MDECVKDLSNFIFDIGVSCSPPLPRAAGKKVQKPNFLQTKTYKSKTKTYFTIFFDNSKEEAFMYIMYVVSLF